MSVIKVSGNTGGTGIFHLRAPNSSTDRFVTLPDVTGNFVTTGDSGTITAPMLDGGQTGSAPAFAARAWVNFNGTGTVAIRDSGNVSSITDNNTGNYTINFTTSMEDANYCAVGSASGAAAGGGTYVVGMYSGATGSQQVAVCRNDENITTPTDRDAVLVAIFR